MTTQYKAPALEKGLDVLEYLAGVREPQSMAAITAAIGRSRSEIYRMVYVLEQRGYLRRVDGTDAFELTNRLFELGMNRPPIADLQAASIGEMNALAARLRQSVQLVVASGDQIVVIGRVESPGDMGFSVRVGYRRPIVRSTSGIVLYAFASEAKQKRLLDTIMEGNPPKKLVAAFKRDARTAYPLGYVQHPSAFVDGITDIGAPIFDGIQDGPVASLTIPFVSGRDARVGIEEATEKVVETGERITRTLQGRVDSKSVTASA